MRAVPAGGGAPVRIRTGTALAQGPRSRCQALPRAAGGPRAGRYRHACRRWRSAPRVRRCRRHERPVGAMPAATAVLDSTSAVLIASQVLRVTASASAMARDSTIGPLRRESGFRGAARRLQCSRAQCAGSALQRMCETPGALGVVADEPGLELGNIAGMRIGEKAGRATIAGNAAAPSAGRPRCRSRPARADIRRSGCRCRREAAQ